MRLSIIAATSAILLLLGGCMQPSVVEKAKAGDLQAQYTLGLMYGFGHEVAQNYVRAYFWSNLAAGRGEVEAQPYRDSTASKLTPSQRAQADLLASACAKKGYINCQEP